MIADADQGAKDRLGRADPGVPDARGWRLLARS
jgi:hypothetical protein